MVVMVAFQADMGKMLVFDIAVGSAETVICTERGNIWRQSGLLVESCLV